MHLLPRIPKAVLFDMDGLMFDTEALYRDATLAAAKEAGFELPISVYLETVGLPSSQARELLIAHFSNHIDLDDLWTKASELFDQAAQTDLRTKPGLLEILSFLDEREMPLAIVTSSSRATVDRHLIAAGLQDRFKTVVARGDYSKGKPHPAPYLLAAERIGLHVSECVALEDSHNGVLSASSAGAMTVMVPDLVQPTDDIRDRCECIFSDLHAVRNLLASNIPASQRHRLRLEADSSSM